MITDDRMAEIVLANKYSSDPLAIYRAIEAEVHEELRKQEPVAWADAKPEGYTYHGMRELPKGKHYLYAAPMLTPSQQEAKPKAGETWYILHQDARACRTVTIAEITEATVLFEPERYVSSGERVPLNRVKFIELARPDEGTKP